ncbi:phage baseplate assembly protein V [Limnohabitans sp.]|uniref:phage baseplate assembly protein V n=1 Tax=Limnohabitans sp. TaxID=1907725 RepID=UPI00286F4909|nr:phage baseplate assembly protein V [Limnohabitans sp.]
MNAVWQRLRLMVAQGVATLVGGEYVQVTVLDGETLPKVRRVEPYGMSSRPKPGAQVYMVFPSGDRALGMALVIGDKRYQMDLQAGEVALHDDLGNFVKLGADGIVTVNASSKVIANAPMLEVTGDVHVIGELHVAGAAFFNANLDVKGQLSQGGKDVGNAHTHQCSLPGKPSGTVI